MLELTLNSHIIRYLECGTRTSHQRYQAKGGVENCTIRHSQIGRHLIRAASVLTCISESAPSLLAVLMEKDTGKFHRSRAVR